MIRALETTGEAALDPCIDVMYAMKPRIGLSVLNLAKCSYAVEGYRRLVCLKAKKPIRWLVLSRILVPSTKALARSQINASSPWP